MLEIEKELIQRGHFVVLPRNAKDYAEGSFKPESSFESTQNKINHDLIRDYYNEIKDSDIVLILNLDKNDVVGYIGGNSFLEMGFAHVLNKKVFLLKDIPEMIYSDEIKAIQSVILNGNLDLIK